MRNHKGLTEVYSREGYPGCVGSGHCCATAPCSLASRKYGESWTSPCPSLVERNGRHWCEEYLEAEDKAAVARELHIGAGCSSSLNSERKERVREILAGKRLTSGEVRLADLLRKRA